MTIVAILDSLNCTAAIRRSNDPPTVAATFPTKMGGTAASAWLRRFFVARRKTKDRMHITADRFVRYSKTMNSRDSLLDLCISLAGCGKSVVVG